MRPYVYGAFVITGLETTVVDLQFLEGRSDPNACARSWPGEHHRERPYRGVTVDCIDVGDDGVSTADRDEDHCRGCGLFVEPSGSGDRRAHDSKAVYTHPRSKNAQVSVTNRHQR